MKYISLGKLDIPIVKPEKGIDYYTDAEIQEIINNLYDKINTRVQDAETIRQNAEVERQEEENQRISSEEERQSNEAERKLNEESRINNEATREQNELQRQESFDEKIAEINDSILNIKDLTEEYNSNAEVETQEFNNNAQVKTEEFNSNAENILDLFPQGQSSGENITLNDSADYRFKSFEVRGNSKQETREGYNYFDAGNLKLTSTTQMTQSWENDVLTVTSSGLNYALARQDITDLIKNNPGKVLTFDYEDITFTQRDVSTGSPVQLNIYFDDGTANQYLKLVDYKSSKFPYSIPEDISNISSVLLCVYSFNGSENDSEFTITITKPMLYLGTEEKEYEQYGAMPSLDYKSDVKSCGDDINLFDKNNATTLRATVGVSTIESSPYSVDAKTFYIPIIGGETYTVSRREVVGIRFVVATTVEIPNVDVSVADRIVANSSKSITVSTSSTANYLVVYYRYDSSEDEATILSSIKICKGTSAGAYSPYGQGSIEIYNCNKNLFNKEAITESYYLNQGNGVLDSSTSSNVSDYIPVIANETYIVTYDYDTLVAQSKRGYCYFDKNKTYLKGSEYTPSNKTFTLIPTEDGYIRFAYDKNCTNIMVRKGETSTDYIEHKSQTLTIPTQKPFRKIGDYADTFIKVNEKWYERHYVERVILDGSTDENWVLESSGRFTSTIIQNLVEKASSNSVIANAKCNYLTTSTANDTWNNANINGISISTNGNIGIRITSLTTVKDFTNWLSSKYNAGTPLYVDYILSTPKDIECTEEQSKILDEIDTTLKSYKNITNIYSTDEVPANLDVVYFKDIETLIGGA